MHRKNYVISRVEYPLRLVVTGRVTAKVNPVSREVAGKTADHIKKKPCFNLGVGTGSTLEALYAPFIDKVRERKVDLAQVLFFGLDEYFGGARALSYGTILRNGLFNPLGIRPEQLRLLLWETNHPQLTCSLFERDIVDAGEIDLQWLGLGMTGHIGFNEPGSSFGSITRLLHLAKRTRIANSPFFMTEGDRRTLDLGPKEGGGLEDPYDKSKLGEWYPYQARYFENEVLSKVPGQAMTQGIATILRAGELFLLATGKKKAKPVQHLLFDAPNVSFPATALRFHPRATVYVDVDAASELPRPYCQEGIYSI